MNSTLISAKPSVVDYLKQPLKYFRKKKGKTPKSARKSCVGDTPPYRNSCRETHKRLGGGEELSIARPAQSPRRKNENLHTDRGDPASEKQMIFHSESFCASSFFFTLRDKSLC